MKSRKLGPYTHKAGAAIGYLHVRNGAGLDTMTTFKEPANILLVDDDSRNLDVLESILSIPDHRLFRARTADEALLALIADEFAVIVLDVRMPDVSGYELAQLIKQRKRTQHIPFSS